MTLKRLAAALLVGAAMLLSACGGGGGSTATSDDGGGGSGGDATPRFTDNGDGTVSDAQTGLMWEKKTGGQAGDFADPHNVNNTYSWSATGVAPDGQLYELFLKQLNGQVEANGGQACFAGHCDWRIPTDEELQSIIATIGCGSDMPCINFAFGPTQASDYWSSSSVNFGFAWGVFFGSGHLGALNKTLNLFARAVRGGR